ncbi:Uncharacterised protein [Yersinia pseudotuberculosis]|nr:Uncharacterised protein [Yersinia pseudotuberculosis]
MCACPFPLFFPPTVASFCDFWATGLGLASSLGLASGLDCVSTFGLTSDLGILFSSISFFEGYGGTGNDVPFSSQGCCSLKSIPLSALPYIISTLPGYILLIFLILLFLEISEILTLKRFAIFDRVSFDSTIYSIGLGLLFSLGFFGCSGKV